MTALPQQSNYELPAFPVTVMKLLREISNEECVLTEIAGIVQEDMAISAKLISVANSPSYRSRREIETIGHAVSWLGKEATAAITLSLSMSSLVQSRPDAEAALRHLWLHSFIQGIAMEEVAYAVKIWNTNKAYIAGLLMDIGQLTQVINDPAEFERIHNIPGITIQERLHHEEAVYQHSYVEIGDQVVRQLELPEDFRIAASEHLSTIEQLDAITDKEQRLYVASACLASRVGDYFCDTDKVSPMLEIRRIAIRFFDMNDDALCDMMQSIEDRAMARASVYDIEAASLPSVKRLTGLAVEQLSRQLLSASMPVDPGVEADRLRDECEQLRQQLAAAEDRACRDSMTRCYNREYFEGRLQERIRQCQLDGRMLSLMMIDVDDFKIVNDTHGHLVGDDVLKDLAAELLAIPGKVSTACRYGGDEFVLLLDMDQEDQLTEVGEAVVRAFAARRGEQEPTSISLSVGAVVAQPFAGDDDCQLKMMKIADQAMYESKKTGSGKVVIGPWPGRSDRGATSTAVSPFAAPCHLENGSSADPVSI